MKSVLCTIFPGFEEIEAVAPIDILRRAGVKVATASLSGDETVAGRSGIKIVCDTTLPGAEVDSFDAIFIPGGPGVYNNLDNAELLRLVKKFRAEKKLIAAICAAPLILDKAKVLGGAGVAIHPSAEKFLDAKAQTVRVASEDSIITSRGAGTAIEFALKIVEELCGAESAKKIAESICF